MKRLIPTILVILLIPTAYYFSYLSNKNSQPIQFDDLIHYYRTETPIDIYLQVIGFKYDEYSYGSCHIWSYNYQPHNDRAEMWCFVNYGDDEYYFTTVFFVLSEESAYNFLVKDIQEKCQYVHDVDYMKVYYHYLTNILFYCGYDSETDSYGINLMKPN